MKAWQRIASLFLLIMMGGCGSVSEPAPLVPLENPPNAKQMVRAVLKPDTKADKKPKKKPDKTPDKKSDAKPDSKSVVEREEKSNRVTAIINRYGWAEISKPRQVNIVAGWTWQVCLKGKRNGNLIYMAVFIQNHAIINVRTSVAIDRCESESYEPL